MKSAPILALATLLMAMLSSPSWAVLPDERLDDPALEARARAISSGLRCLVCQNQSIDESEADLASDLRRLVRERLLAGDTDDQTIAFIVDRYGDYVLLNPPFKSSTLVLWATPLVLAGAAGAGAWIAIRAAKPKTLEPSI